LCLRLRLCCRRRARPDTTTTGAPNSVTCKAVLDGMRAGRTYVTESCAVSVAFTATIAGRPTPGRHRRNADGVRGRARRRAVEVSGAVGGFGTPIAEHRALHPGFTTPGSARLSGRSGGAG
jgi:hypothetical protein